MRYILSLFLLGFCSMSFADELDIKIVTDGTRSVIEISAIGLGDDAVETLQNCGDVVINSKSANKHIQLPKPLKIRRGRILHKVASGLPETGDWAVVCDSLEVAVYEVKYGHPDELTRMLGGN